MNLVDLFVCLYESYGMVNMNHKLIKYIKRQWEEDLTTQILSFFDI